jgi:tetratricopeptide (TPR) repeat protein
MPSGVVFAQEASAQAEGRARFRRGVDFFKEGDYRAALIEFRRAYELAPNYKLLYNLGQTSLELQDYASALRSFERYLAEGGREIAAARRAQVEGEIERLKRRVARVEVTTNVSDAEIFVDDVSVGRTPLPGPLAVSAGRRKISALKGGLTAVRMIDVAGGDSTSVSLEILEPATPSPAAPSPTAPTRTSPSEATRPPAAATATTVSAVSAPAPSSSNTAFWIGITATGALAAGSAAAGILTLQAKKDFDNTLARYPVDPQEISDARSKTRSLALVADVLGGAAIVAGGLTIIAAVSGGSSSKERAQGLRVDVTPGGLVASGRF